MTADQQPGDPRADAVLKNLPADKLDALWLLRHPEDETESVRSYDEIVAMLPDVCGVSASRSAVWEFYRWLSLKRRWDQTAQTAAQVRLELLKDESIDPARIEAVAQSIFTAEALEGGNVKAYVELAKVRLKGIEIEQAGRKIKLLEDKARRLDEIEAKAKELTAGGGLSAETLDVIEKQLKLL